MVLPVLSFLMFAPVSRCSGVPSALLVFRLTPFFIGVDRAVLIEPPTHVQILLTERFDEGLMVLRNLLGWHLVDMTYVTVNRTAGREGRKGILKDRSPFDELPKDVSEGAPPLEMH